MTPAEIVAEFRKKYEGTYVFVQTPDSKEESLFHMDRVTAGGDGHGMMQLSSEEFGKIRLNMATAHTIRFAFPKCGTFQNGSNAYLFRREPRRQWQRGLCSGNGAIIDVSSAVIEGHSRTAQMPFDFTNVAAAFAGITYPFKAAVTMLASGKYRSVALAGGFALMLSPLKTAASLLVYGGNAIALLDKDGAIIRVLEIAFDRQIKEVVA